MVKYLELKLVKKTIWPTVALSENMRHCHFKLAHGPVHILQKPWKERLSLTWHCSCRNMQNKRLISEWNTISLLSVKATLPVDEGPINIKTLSTHYCFYVLQ